MAKRKPRLADLERKSPNQERAKRTVENIIAAAEKVLSREGIEALTIRKIALTAGVSLGLLYDYFPNKQAVLYRIYEARLEERLQFFDEAFSESAPGRTFAATFDRFLELQRQAAFPSRVDLELQKAIERDQVLARMTRHYEDALSRRYVEIWHRYGSDWPDDRLMQLAKFAHELDHANLKLQSAARPGKSGFYGKLTTQLFYCLVSYCGASTGE